MKTSITFAHQVLYDFLSIGHVPFLYAVNRRIEILDTISNPGSSVFFESFTRPGKYNQVDGYFRIKFDSSFALMTVNCKNINKFLTCDKVKKFLYQKFV